MDITRKRMAYFVEIQINYPLLHICFYIKKIQLIRQSGSDMLECMINI